MSDQQNSLNDVDAHAHAWLANSRAPSRRFLSLPKVLDMLSVSRSTLYASIHDDELPFPTPVHIGRRSVWIEGEVLDYMEAIIMHSRN